MLLKTTKFGEIEVNEDYIFEFVEPIIGYDKYKRFAFVDYNEDSPFKWLQAVDEPALALPVTIPAYFGIPYQFTIPDEKEKVLEMSIDELELSVRSYNCLKRAGINTIGDLIQKNEEEMMRVRNLGRKSLKEVVQKLHERNLDLKRSYDTDSSYEEDDHDDDSDDSSFDEEI